MHPIQDSLIWPVAVVSWGETYQHRHCSYDNKDNRVREWNTFGATLTYKCVVQPVTKVLFIWSTSSVTQSSVTGYAWLLTIPHTLTSCPPLRQSVDLTAPSLFSRNAHCPRSSWLDSGSVRGESQARVGRAQVPGTDGLRGEREQPRRGPTGGGEGGRPRQRDRAGPGRPRPWFSRSTFHRPTCDGR